MKKQLVKNGSIVFDGIHTHTELVQEVLKEYEEMEHLLEILKNAIKPNNELMARIEKDSDYKKIKEWLEK